MLAKPTDVLPVGPNWRFEPKYDGLRCTAVVTDTAVQLITRQGNRVTKQFPELVAAFAELRMANGADFILDGEVVARSSDGYAGFSELLRRINLQDRFRIKLLSELKPASFVSFDLLVHGRRAFLDQPLLARRAALEALLAALPEDAPQGAETEEEARERKRNRALRLAEQGEDGAEMLDRAYGEDLEGLVAKDSRSPYLPGQRTPAWQKYKFTRRQEFVVAGFTASDRRPFGALVVGFYSEGRLIYAGEVGSGFRRRDLMDIDRKLGALIRSKCPFPALPDLTKPATWVEPRLVAEVAFDCWTEDLKLRCPRFKGLRHDKPALSVVRETS